MTNKIIIAIDGCSSTGKSTLASILADYLSYKHINTGSMYRAVTLNAIRQKWIHSLNKTEFRVNKEKIISTLDELKLDFSVNSKGECKMYMNGKDVDFQLKSPAVSMYVSQISQIPLIRQKIVKMQQDIGREKGVVMEGRDIGSVVFPEAELKLFITASLEVRVQRRYSELIGLGLHSSVDEVLYNLKMRDSEDSNRQDSPLIMVKDAILIDNSLLSIEDQFNFVLELIKKKSHFL
ncbi:(d)CMP kinase [Flavobacteriales bacterium]|nr:(d)CMP kinase [Flavobacteriales bacterium]